MSIPSRFKTGVFSRTVMLWHIYNFGPEYFITPFCEPSAEQITTATNYWALTTLPTILHTPPNIILYNSCMRWVLSSPCSRLEKRRLTQVTKLKMPNGSKSQSWQQKKAVSAPVLSPPRWPQCAVTQVTHHEANQMGDCTLLSSASLCGGPQFLGTTTRTPKGKSHQEIRCRPPRGLPAYAFGPDW